MYLYLIPVQEVPFYNVYKSELFLWAICCSFCQFYYINCFVVNDFVSMTNFHY